MSFSVCNFLVSTVLKKSTEKKTVWLMLMFILFTTTACKSVTDSATPQPGTTVPSHTNKLTATSVNNLPYFFPQQEAVDGERLVMEAEIFGTLVIVDECVRVNDSNSNISYLLVWPPDFSLSTESDPIQILDGDGKVVARVGDMVQIGGGEVKSLSFLNESLQKNLPPNCVAPYWIVGDEVNMLETSE